MAKKSTIREKTAETILQSPFSVKVGAKTYTVAPPCAATLIAVSGMLDRVPMVEQGGVVLNEALACAKHCRGVLEITAMLILGHKRYAENHKVVVGKGWRKRRRSEFDVLVEELSEECTPKELYDIVLEVLTRMQVRDFFSLTVSLHEMSLIQKTRETAMTQFGQL